MPVFSQDKHFLGELVAWPVPYTTAAPTGYVDCDGQAISRTTFAEYFALVGTVFGAGDGSTTFNVPDSRNRSLLGAGNGGGAIALAANDGAAVGARLLTHTHGPGSLTGTTGVPSATVASGILGVLVNAASPTHTHATSVTAGVTGSTNNGPYLGIRYIVRVL